MPDRLVNVERQGARVLHTDTLARRSAGEEPEANLDQVVRDRAHLLWEQAGRPDDRAGVQFKPMQGRFGLSDLAGGRGWRSGS